MNRSNPHPTSQAQRTPVNRRPAWPLTRLAALLLAASAGATPQAQAAGLANRYDITQLGLVDAEHTNSLGAQYSIVEALNSAGQAAGWSQRYSVDYGLTGYSTWLYSGGITRQIGLVGAGYSHTGDGFQSSSIAGISAAGEVAGTSRRYDGNTFLGNAAWLYSGGTALDIGLGGYGYTRPGSGESNSGVVALNTAGQVAGWSTTYAATGFNGQAAWVYGRGTTQLIGLTGAGHTRQNGTTSNEVIALNGQGQAIGYATRIGNQDAAAGASAWVFDGAHTQAIGLTDAAHTGPGGYQLNLSKALNDAGQVAGVADRYVGGQQVGTDAWFYSGGSSRQIGLSGGLFTDPVSGAGYHFATALNAAGLVAGYSRRLNGATPIGNSAWIYDSAQDLTYDLTFSVRHDGAAFSSIEYLGDSGLALGEYNQFFGNTNLGRHAFAWTAAGGMVDLGWLVDGGLGVRWQDLATAYLANSAGQIAGEGNLANGGLSAFLMTPVAAPVPEPQGYALLLAGLGALGLRARRQRAAAAAA